MRPVSPVLRGFEDHEIVFAKDQPQYIPLPALPSSDGRHIITRWRPTLRERARIASGADLFLQVITGGRPLQPLRLTVEAPERV